MPDLATLTAILYAARLTRRVPETNGEKQRAIAESVADARLILAATTDKGADFHRNLSQLLETDTPEQPPPSPGNKTGVLAEAKVTRRRG
jgi:hypothetical protein